MLAERNRREQLVRASEAAAQAEVDARAALQQAAAAAAQADSARDRLIKPTNRPSQARLGPRRRSTL